MNKVIKLTIDKPDTRRGRSAIAELVKSLDDLLESYDVFPVLWTSDVDEEGVVFTAYIPADCMPEFDQAADCLASRFNEFREE